MKNTFLFALSMFLYVFYTPDAVAQTDSFEAKPTVPVELYTLDGGHLYFNNMGIFYDTGEHEGERGEMVVPCYLIHHGKDWLLWDTGNGDDMHTHKDGVMKIGIHFTVTKTLKEQLAQLNLIPNDITYVVLSHLHPDHTGNIGLFSKAKFLVSAEELKWANTTPAPAGIIPSMLTPLKSADISASDSDINVFGDGSVMVFRTPGHTPGHRSLLVKLPKSGNVMITGDLYHTKEGMEKKMVDDGNFNRAEELASFDRFDRMVKNLHARIIIQHSPEDYAAMPAFPKFLE